MRRLRAVLLKAAPGGLSVDDVIGCSAECAAQAAAASAVDGEVLPFMDVCSLLLGELKL